MDTDLLLLYRHDWIRKCLSVASYTCLVYDHILTFDREVDFIWRAPWTFTKAVFLLNRYGGLICQTVIQFVKLVGVALHGAGSCDVPLVFLVMYSVPAMESIHILVLLRAWATWGCQRRIAVMLVGSYSIYFLLFLIKAIFSVMSVTTRTFQYANLPEPRLIAAISSLAYSAGAWILSLAHACHDTVVFVITMISLRRHSRNSQHLYPTSLLVLLVRDAIMFYIASMFCDISNAVTWIIYPSNPFTTLSLTFTVNILSIAGQRFVLNLRGFTVRTYGSRSLSAEVDRQLQMFNGTQRLEWWSTSTSQASVSRVGNQQGTDRNIEMDGLDHDLNGRWSGTVEAVAIVGGDVVLKW